jgi:hypothetical protein
MADSTVPRNRRERRAAAAKASKTSTTTNTSTPPIDDPFAADEIPMVTPDYDAKPTGKTLYQVIDERYAELHGAEGEDELDDPLGAFANAIIYTVSLSMLHVTLDVIVLSQYGQDIEWHDILTRIGKMTPALFAVVYLFHTENIKRWHRVRQLFFLVTSVVAGCYLIYAGNVYGYYFVMKKAPPMGTLWVWSVVEMDLWYAVGHAVAVLGFMKYGGYRAF